MKGDDFDINIKEIIINNEDIIENEIENQNNILNLYKNKSYEIKIKIIKKGNKMINPNYIPLKNNKNNKKTIKNNNDINETDEYIYEDLIIITQESNRKFIIAISNEDNSIYYNLKYVLKDYNDSLYLHTKDGLITYRFQLPELLNYELYYINIISYYNDFETNIKSIKFMIKNK